MLHPLLGRTGPLKKSKIIEAAVDVGIIVGLVDFFTTEEKHKTHDAKLDKVQLENRVAELEDHISEIEHDKHKKSHVDRLKDHDHEHEHESHEHHTR